LRQNRITYLFLITLCAAFLFVHDGRITWVAFYAVLILPAISLLYMVISMRGMAAEHAADSDHIIKGDEIVYRVTLTNSGWMPVPIVRIQFADEDVEFSPFETPKNTKIVFVPRRKSMDVDFSVQCAYRGVFELQAHTVEVMDVLGLFSIKMQTREPLEVLVYPALKEVKNIPLSAVNTSDAPSIRETADEDYAVVTDLRKYQPEDSFKRVHWKISAKKSELMIKSFQSVNLNAAVIAINNQNVPFDRPHTDMERILVEDKLVECALSFAHYGLARRFPVELLYLNEGLCHVAEGSYEGFGNIYNICAGIEFNNLPNFTHHMEGFLYNQSEFINLVVLTPSLNRVLCEQVRAAKAAGHNLILVYTETRRSDATPSLDEGFRKLLLESGVAVYYMPFEMTVEEVVS